MLFSLQISYIYRHGLEHMKGFFERLESCPENEYAEAFVKFSEQLFIAHSDRKLNIDEDNIGGHPNVVCHHIGIQFLSYITVPLILGLIR